MPDKNKIKVLLIDDDEEDFILTREQLFDVGARKYNIDWLSSFDEGLEAVLNNKYDVCLIDYRLGSNNGLDLIKEAIEKGCKTPMILLTGQGAMEIDERAMKIGAADYLIKGATDAYQVDRSIRYAIKHFEMLDEVRSLNAELESRVQRRTQELKAANAALENTNASLMEQIKERKAVEDALSESQKLYLAIAANYPNGMIAVFDKEMHFIFAEGKGMKDAGMPHDRVIGRKLQEVMEPDHYKEAYPYFAEGYKGNNGVYEIKYGDHYFLNTIAPLMGNNGIVHEVMLVSQNITMQKQAEKDILKALDKEKALNELKSRFVSMASHEFRTPLATILSSVTLVDRYNGPEDAEKRAKHINRIKSSVDNMTEILNDFLSLGKLEEGMIYNMPDHIDVVGLCEDIKEEIQITSKQGQSVIYSHQGPCEAYIDKQLFRNVLLNLLSNAVKYSLEDKPIYFGTILENDKLVINIRDQGIGIPVEDQQYIFSNFFRANNVTNIQGTGLGLNIVKKYLELMEGEISFESNIGQGTSFTVTINQNHTP